MKKELTEKAALQIVNKYGFSSAEYANVKESLKARFKKEPQVNDLVWSILCKLIIKYSSDFDTLQQIYYEQALLLAKEGKPTDKIRQFSSKFELLSYKQKGVSLVEILAATDSCKNCETFNGKQYSISSIIENSPIPVKKCSRPLFNSAGFCRCTFLPGS